MQLCKVVRSSPAGGPSQEPLCYTFTVRTSIDNRRTCDASRLDMSDLFSAFSARLQMTKDEIARPFAYITITRKKRTRVKMSLLITAQKTRNMLFSRRRSQESRFHEWKNCHEWNWLFTTFWPAEEMAKKIKKMKGNFRLLFYLFASALIAAALSRDNWLKLKNKNRKLESLFIASSQRSEQERGRERELKVVPSKSLQIERWIKK